jgi:signal transduction histidine kinase
VQAAAAGRDGVVATVDGPVTVSGEPDALARALDNLLENAARHGPADGKVRIALTQSGEEAQIAVSDDGPGFAPGTEEAAFDRFWRGDGTAAPGSGLGLAIVRATAERHGGRAWAAGSTVTVALPISSSAVNGQG